MEHSVKANILSQARAAHALTEASYQTNPAKKGEAGWEDKQRILLADMSLHLLQTALRHGELSKDDLKRNLFSILTISDQLIPGHDLAMVADRLYAS